MARGNGQSAAAGRSVLLGEAVRRFALRPETTSLAAVGDSLHRLHDPQPGPFSQQADLYQLDVGRRRAWHRQHRRDPADDRRPFRSIRRRRARARFLCLRAADARLWDSAGPGGSRRGRRGSGPRRRQWRPRRQVPHPLVCRHARNHADLARRRHRVDRRLSDDRGDTVGLQGHHVGAAARWLQDVGALVLRHRGVGHVSVDADPLRKLGPGARAK